MSVQRGEEEEDPLIRGLEEQLQYLHSHPQDRLLVAAYDLHGSCREHTEHSKHLDLLLRCPCQKEMESGTNRGESGLWLGLSDGGWRFVGDCADQSSRRCGHRPLGACG